MSSDFYTTYIRPHTGIIIKICRAYTNTQEDFEDYFQEVCLQIWRSKENFKSNADWSTWVYRIALNVCLTLLKKKKNNVQNFASDYLPQDMQEDAQVFVNEDLDMLYDAIRKLSVIDRAIILLYLEEKSYKEIAETFDATPNSIGVKIKRIKERLKKLLDGKVN